MTKLRFFTGVALLITFGGFAPSPARAASAAIGSVAGSLNASVGGQALLPNSIIFSGDRLQVKDGVAVVALGRGSRMAFGRETEAGFLKDANGIAVLLESGSVSIYHPASGGAVRLMAGKVEVRPGAGYKSLAEIAMSRGMILVTAREGALRVTGDGHAVELAQGKSLCIQPRISGFPQGAPAANAGAPPSSGSSDHTWRVMELAVGGTGAILGAVAVGKSGSANSTANLALSTSKTAAGAAAAASAAAQAASEAATAATEAAAEAAALAQASANLSELANNALGCKLNLLANELGQASPYTPPPGFSCGH